MALRAEAPVRRLARGVEQLVSSVHLAVRGILDLEPGCPAAVALIGAFRPLRPDALQVTLAGELPAARNASHPVRGGSLDDLKSVQQECHTVAHIVDDDQIRSEVAIYVSHFDRCWGAAHYNCSCILERAAIGTEQEANGVARRGVRAPVCYSQIQVPITV